MTQARKALLLLPLTILAVALGAATFTVNAQPLTYLGIYPPGELASSIADVQALDDWTGVKNSIVATFLDLNDDDPVATISTQLEAAWQAGYAPFVNLRPAPIAAGPSSAEVSPQEIDFSPKVIAGVQSCPFTATASEIAQGTLDTEIRAWASAFSTWSNGGEKVAFIAPLHEMNWICYGESPADFKLAFLRIQIIFDQEGVPEDAVSWVFHVNNQSAPGNPPFEEYYPGNSFVDVVSFSAYNWGACSPWGQVPEGSDAWKSAESLYGPNLARMRSMAPGKPIFVAETGTTSWPDPGSRNLEQKDAWLGQAYAYLASSTAVRAVLYFNMTISIEWDPPLPPCDFTIDPSEYAFGDYRSALASYGSLEANEMKAQAFDRTQGIFEDVWPVHPFAGVTEWQWYLPWVESIALAGITAGCQVAEHDIAFAPQHSDVSVRQPFYCPQALVIRAEMAVFLLKGMNGEDYQPPDPGGGSFNDVSGHWAESWIEALKASGITAGYPDGTYRPGLPVTRAEMAVFLLKAKYGSGYSPPDPAGLSFVDISGHWAEAWIEQLKEEGITSGYPDGTYRAENQVTRAEMAVFLVQTFSLPGA